MVRSKMPKTGDFSYSCQTVAMKSMEQASVGLKTTKPIYLHPEQQLLWFKRLWLGISRVKNVRKMFFFAQIFLEEKKILVFF